MVEPSPVFPCLNRHGTCSDLLKSIISPKASFLRCTQFSNTHTYWMSIKLDRYRINSTLSLSLLGTWTCFPPLYLLRLRIISSRIRPWNITILFILFAIEQRFPNCTQRSFIINWSKTFALTQKTKREAKDSFIIYFYL